MKCMYVHIRLTHYHSRAVGVGNVKYERNEMDELLLQEGMSYVQFRKLYGHLKCYKFTSSEFMNYK